MKKVYCDTGGWVSALKKYKGIVQFCGFYFENSNKDLTYVSHPSLKSWSAKIKLGFGDYNCTFDELGPSEKFDEIEKIIGQGPNYINEVHHMDSAYRNGCSYFLTSDNDILNKRTELEILLNIKIFNPHK